MQEALTILLPPVSYFVTAADKEGRPHLAVFSLATRTKKCRHATGDRPIARPTYRAASATLDYLPTVFRERYECTQYTVCITQSIQSKEKRHSQ